MSEREAVLVVGAGAVGQVYARHLQLGGADVTFLVREKYRQAAEHGFDLYPLNGARAPLSPVQLKNVKVVTSVAELAGTNFKQVFLTVASTALADPWLPELCAAIGDATLIGFQPGPESRATLLKAGIPESRLVSGALTLISYSAPLPGETRFPRPGMAYWFPPFSKGPFSGPTERTAAVIDRLNRGGLASTRSADAARGSAFPTAILMPFLFALETAGWAFNSLNEGNGYTLAAEGIREALAITELASGPRPFGAGIATRPFALKLALKLAALLIPLPLEAYLKDHFTKVGAQTRLIISSYIAIGRKNGRGVTALEQLQAALPAPNRPRLEPKKE